MKINVIYTGILSEVTNLVEEEIEVTDSITVYQLIEILLKKYGKPFENILIQKSTKKLKIPIYINGKFKAENIQLKHSDRVGFIFTVSGG